MYVFNIMYVDLQELELPLFQANAYILLTYQYISRKLSMIQP